MHIAFIVQKKNKLSADCLWPFRQQKSITRLTSQHKKLHVLKVESSRGRRSFHFSYNLLAMIFLCPQS